MWWGRRRRRRNQSEPKQRKHRLFLPFLSIPFISSSGSKPEEEASPEKPLSPEPNVSPSIHPIEENHGSDQSICLDQDHPTFEDQFSSQIRGVPVSIKSRDPERDFKESMEEMIRANGIQRLEELESLLEVYLLANDEKHGDLIVRAFQRVWFEISFERFRS